MMMAMLGGALIGVAVSLMLLLNGRVTGISGIMGGGLSSKPGDRSWRWFFVLGLLTGGFILRAFRPELILQATLPSSTQAILAGVLVGFGTLLGNGCTSGHGVCGLSRFSLRSLVATVTFILAGMATVYFGKGVL